MVGVHGIEELNGETLPMDIWSSYMAQATEGEPSLSFPEPDPGRFRFVYGDYYPDF